MLSLPFHLAEALIKKRHYLALAAEKLFIRKAPSRGRRKNRGEEEKIAGKKKNKKNETNL